MLNEKDIEKMNMILKQQKAISLLNYDLKNYVNALLMDLKNRKFDKDFISKYKGKYNKICKERNDGI